MLLETIKNKFFLSSKIRKFNKEGKNKLLVIGDSHSEVFLNENIINALKEYQLNVVSIGGATVSGLANPNSKTNAKKVFEYSLKKIKPKTLISLLGEVDTGFLIWHKAEHSKLSINEIYKNTLNKYQDFIINNMRKNKISKIIIISAPLPTIKKYSLNNEVGNIRSKIKATYEQRKKLTMKFNEDLFNFCKKKKFIFLDLTNDVIDKNNNIKQEFFSNSPFDHHYKKEVYSKLIIEKLKKLL